MPRRPPLSLSAQGTGSWTLILAEFHPAHPLIQMAVAITGTRHEDVARPGRTQTLPVAIYDAVQAQRYTDASLMVLVITGLVFAGLDYVHQLRVALWWIRYTIIRLTYPRISFLGDLLSPAMGAIGNANRLAD